MIVVAVVVIHAIVVIVVFTYVHMHVCRVVHGGAHVFLHAVDGGNLVFASCWHQPL